MGVTAEITPEAVLQVSRLSVAYRVANDKQITVVAGVDLDLTPGSIVGLVGESGCGKSTTGLIITGYPLPGAAVLEGDSVLDGTSMFALDIDRRRSFWGRDLAYVAQAASTSLNPSRRIAYLMTEAFATNLGVSSTEAREQAVAMLGTVGIPDPESALKRFPHEFSGGQQQRIALAMSMGCRPRVLILDEPTSGLDVTTQQEMNDLITRLVAESSTAALYISHDLGSLARVATELVVMYAGEVVERGPAAEVLAAPRHPYSAALRDALPRADDPSLPVGIPGRPPSSTVDDACAFVPRCRFSVDRCAQAHPALESPVPGREVRCVRTRELGIIAPQRLEGRTRSSAQEAAGAVLEGRDLTCRYGPQVAVSDVSFSLPAGRTLAIVGESGSGKSTLLRAIAGLHAPERGTIRFEGRELAPRATRRSRADRRALQLVFQSADTSLNPRHTVEQLLVRPLALFRPELGRRAHEVAGDLLDEVGLDRELLDRRPHQLSGGQKQRVAIARAFAAEPRVLLCDEIVSALDVSVAASILGLVARLTRERDTAVVFVTHNLAVVRAISDAVIVMKDASVVEAAATDELFESPREPYTRQLLAAARGSSGSVGKTA